MGSNNSLGHHTDVLDDIMEEDWSGLEHCLLDIIDCER